jgi:hypothetical protein
VELSPDQRGSLAELAIAHHAGAHGVGVLWPLTSGLRYDLVLDVAGALFRVQCKTAVRKAEIVVINCRSCRRTADGYDRRAYSSDDVDLIAGYCAELDRSYLLEPWRFSGQTMVLLRLAPTKNNQRQRINWAKDFDFAARLRALGAVAQMGERLTGSQKVTGSIPVGSTSIHEAFGQLRCPGDWG